MAGYVLISTWKPRCASISATQAFPWQVGTNENTNHLSLTSTNRLLREYFPKKRLSVDTRSRLWMALRWSAISS